VTVSKKDAQEPNEFSHIEVRAIRNPEWLKQFEKQGFFLSETFPLGDFELPEGYEEMTESDIYALRASIRTLVVLKPREDNDE
jgi:hypothetical protein